MKRTEDNIQRAVIKFLRMQYPKVIYLAIPNGGYRSPKEAAIMSGLGVISGAPDILIAKAKIMPIENPNHLMDLKEAELHIIHGLFLELKAPKGRLSENQKIMLKRLKDAGYACEVAYGLDEALKVIKDYLG